VTTTCLRQSIYEPIIDGSLMRHPPKADGAPSKGGRAAEVVIARQASLATAFALATQHSVVGAAAAAAAAAAASAGLVAGDSASAAGSSGSSSSTASDTETDTDGSSEGDQAARRSGDAAGGGGGAGLRRRKPAALARGDDVAALVGSDQGEAVGSVKVGKLPQLQAPLKLAPPPASGAPAPVPEWRKSLATFMVFFMSGVMHEGLIWCERARDSGRAIWGPQSVKDSGRTAGGGRGQGRRASNRRRRPVGQVRRGRALPPGSRCMAWGRCQCRLRWMS
jgi:hypothetical protein